MRSSRAMDELMQPLLLKNTDHPDSAAIDEYLRIGGYRALEKALEMTPAEVVEEVTAIQVCSVAAGPASRPAASGSSRCVPSARPSI